MKQYLKYISLFVDFRNIVKVTASLQILILIFFFLVYVILIFLKQY